MEMEHATDDNDNDKPNNNNNKNNNKHDVTSLFPFTSHHHYPCLSTVSNFIFVIASILYVALSVIVLDYYQYYSNVPTSVLYADDDVTWWNYYNESNKIPQELLLYNTNTTVDADNDDDYVLLEWYNSTFYPNDDIVFQTNPTKETTAVNQYMMIYFLAAIGFLLTGILEYYMSSSGDTGVGCFVCNINKLLAIIFIIAAIFGIVSAMFVVANEYLSSILNAVSVHLFAVEAISIVIKTIRYQHNNNTTTTTTTTTIGCWIWIANISFVIGTCMDVVLSYFYILETATYPHVVASVVAACFWLIAALIYFIITFMDWKGNVGYGYSNDDDDYNDDDDDDYAEDVEKDV